MIEPENPFQPPRLETLGSKENPGKDCQDIFKNGENKGS